MIILTDWQGTTFTVSADNFTIGNNSTGYVMNFDKVRGKDSLSFHRGNINICIIKKMCQIFDDQKLKKGLGNCFILKNMEEAVYRES